MWAVFWAGYVLVRGIPFDRATQVLIIVSAAVAFSWGVRGAKIRAMRDWLPFFGFLYGYDYSRGAADTLGYPVRVAEIYNIELRWFALQGKIPTLWLQQRLYDPQHVAWWESLVALMYCSHFVVPWAVVGYLYIVDRRRWSTM